MSTTMKNDNQKLTIKQEAFAQEVFRTGNQAEAYRIVFPHSRRWKDESVWQSASKLMSKVSPRVAELQGAAAEKAVITRTQWLDEWKALAFTNLPGIINFDKGKMTVTDFAALSDDQRKCIQSFKVKTENEMEWDEISKTMVPVPVQYVEVKLYSKIEALVNIGKALGYDKPAGAGDDEGDGAPVYIGFQQNITVVNR